MADYPDNIRPFVCDGSPFECKIFIVGANPATDMDVPFWRFWNDRRGFHRRVFLDCYLRKRFGKPSNTRERIKRIVEAGSLWKCLETNIWTIPTKRERDLGKVDRHTAIFTFLLQEIKPSIIHFHGTSAHENFQLTLNNGRPKPAMNELRGVEIGGHAVQVCLTKHLRFVKYDEATRIGRSFADFLNRFHNDSRGPEKRTR